MKRWLSLLLIILLLTGCGEKPADPSTPPEGNITPPSNQASTPTTPTDPQQTAPSQPQTTPEEESSLNAMALEGNYLAVAPMGSNLLLFSKNSLSLWPFGASQPIATAKIEDVPLPDSGMLQLRDGGLVYYDVENSALVYLDEQLKTSRTLQLNETVLGSVYLTGDCSRLYFCTAAGIRIWEIETGICRNLKLQDGNWLGINGALMEESALRCQLWQEDGSIRTLLISAATGETLWEGAQLNDIQESGRLYCYTGTDQWLFGLYHEQPQVLHVKNPIPLPQISGALTCEATESGSMLELYDLASGHRTASLEIPGLSKLSGFTAFHNYIWFFGDGKLYRWDPAQNPTQDETVYTGHYYTPENPDIEGLSHFQAQAEELNAHYGIEILLWTDAAAAEPAGYTFEIEYRTDVYAEAFATLEAALAHFPTTLPDRAADWTADGVLRLVLVRSITTPSETAYSTLSGMEYLLDGKVYIVLAMDEHLERSFYHALFHVIDPLVMSNSIAYYKWSDLNPSGFQYDGDYIANLDRDDSQYLEAGKQYFIDTYSMSYAVEDRARIFEYAMLPGNESYFESPHLQAKLKMLCDGLRDTFSLEEERYLWEQYLK